MDLVILITSPSGAVYRCAGDEPNAGWIPFDITWTKVMPGGDNTLGFSLRRRLDEDLPLRLLDEVDVWDIDGERLWSGRIGKMPRQHGDDVLANIQCVGWSAQLLDVPFRENYIDGDLSHWHDPTLGRQATLTALGLSLGGWSSSVGRDPDGNPGIAMVTTDINQPGTVRQIAEMWYDAQGVPIGELDYEFSSAGLGNGAQPLWTTQAALSVDPLGATSIAGTDHDGPDGPLAASVVGDGTHKYAFLRTYFNATYTGGPITGAWAAYWRKLRARGTHGLTLQPDGGLYIDDILANALARTTSKVGWSTGPGGSIERPPTTILQAAYLDPTSFGGEQGPLLDLNKYVLYDWGVDSNRRFFFRPYDPLRLTWHARLGDGARLDLEGDDADTAIQGMIVKYQLVDGTPRVAGPPGYGFDVESALLVDSDSENTATRHGYVGKFGVQDVSIPTWDDGAIAMGAAYLAQTALPARSGDIVVQGTIEHPVKGKIPVRKMNAGEAIDVPDHPQDGGVARKITALTYTHGTKTVSLTIGNQVDKVTAMLEQLGVVTRLKVGVG